VVCERSFVSRTAPLVLPVLVLGPRETDGRRLVQSIQLLELYTVLKRGARLGVDEGLDRPLRRSHEYPSWMQLVEVVNSPPPNHLPRLRSRNPTQKPLWMLELATLIDDAPKTGRLEATAADALGFLVVATRAQTRPPCWYLPLIHGRARPKRDLNDHD